MQPIPEGLKHAAAAAARHIFAELHQLQQPLEPRAQVAGRAPEQRLDATLPDTKVYKKGAYACAVGKK